MRNWGHSTLRVGVSLLWMSDCSVACQFAWRSRCGASPSGQATAAHRAPRSGPCLEACPRDPVPPTPSIPAVHFGLTWGFCTIRSLSSACRRRVAALMVQFPPFAGGVIGRQAAPGASCSAILPFGGALDVGRARPCASNGAIPPFAGSEVAVRGGEVTVCSGEAPTSPTTSPKNADNGGLRARCPASWWQRCLASCVARTRTAEYAR